MAEPKRELRMKVTHVIALILFVLALVVALATWLGAPIANAELVVLAFLAGGLTANEIG